MKQANLNLNALAILIFFVNFHLFLDRLLIYNVVHMFLRIRERQDINQKHVKAKDS